MKFAKSTSLVLALGLAFSGCADPDPHTVNISRPSIWSQLFWSPPKPVGPAPMAPTTTSPTLPAPEPVPPSAPVA